MNKGALGALSVEDQAGVRPSASTAASANSGRSPALGEQRQWTGCLTVELGRSRAAAGECRQSLIALSDSSQHEASG